jgi:two-component system, LuxR family, response regulator FixJ
MQTRRTVFLIHDNDEFSVSLVNHLASLGIETWSFDSALKVLEDVEQLPRPGCVIVNLGQRHLKGEVLLEAFAGSSGRPPAIVLTDNIDVTTTVRAFHCQVKAFFLKPYLAHSEIIDAVEAALSDDEQMLLRRARKWEIEARFNSLTPREREVMNYLVQGDEVTAIAARFQINCITVESHRDQIMMKLKATTFPQLIALAIEHSRRGPTA